MANLIITIISIALVAVAALMGAYYGGSAFLQGQAKAQANAIISQAQQLATGWTAYALNRGGDRVLDNWTTLVPAYISFIPVPPESSVAFIDAGQWDGWGTVNMSDDATAAQTSFSDIADAVIMATDKAEICNQIAKIARGNGAVPIDYSSDKFQTNSNITPANKFDCFAFTDGHVFVYKVF